MFSTRQGTFRLRKSGDIFVLINPMGFVSELLWRRDFCDVITLNKNHIENTEERLKRRLRMLQRITYILLHVHIFCHYLILEDFMFTLNPETKHRTSTAHFQ